MFKKILAAMVFGALATGTAHACPDWQANPSFGQVDLVEGFPRDPWTRRITAGGRYDLGRCFNDNSLVGNTVARKPDYDIYYDTTGRSDLTIWVESRHDTVLLISDPDGDWLFDDDSGGGHDPMIFIPNADSGLYDVWIGSYNGARGLPGTLFISEF